MKLEANRPRPLKFLLENLRDPLTWRNNPLALAPLWRRGFSTGTVLLFGLNEGNWRDYPRDSLRHRITLETNRHVWPVLHDKLWLDSFMRGKLRHVEALFFVVRGKVHQAVNREMDKEGFLEAVAAGQKFVIKPAQDGMGKGTLLVRAEAGQIQVNERNVTRAELDEMLGGLEYHLCYPWVEEHEVLRSLRASSASALRVLAYVSREKRAALFAPVLRLEAGAPRAREHSFRDGIFCEIDEASGVIRRAARRNAAGRREEVLRHPDSGAEVTGMEAPYWQEVRRDILAFHEACPAFDLVGWDVLIGGDGHYVIEGCHSPDLRPHLLFKNLGQDENFGAFMRERGLA